MSNLVARILLSIFVVPVGAIAFFCMVVVLENGTMHETLGLISSMLGAWAAVAAYWCLVWRKGVVWTPKRVTRTWLAAFPAAVAGVVVGGGFVTMAFRADEIDAIIGFGGVLAILFWLMATVLIWRETAVERASRVSSSSKSAVSCPVCGYNLTGLREARCPECGAVFTLDDLMSAQVSDAAVMEDRH